jgi:hypothetical protein
MFTTSAVSGQGRNELLGYVERTLAKGWEESELELEREHDHSAGPEPEEPEED